MGFSAERWESIRHLLRAVTGYRPRCEAAEVRGNADQDPLDLIGAGDQGLMFGSAVA